VRERKVPFVCKTLGGIVFPNGAVFYQVSPVKEGRPSWSPACPLPPAQEIPYPSKVRFLDKRRICRWGFVLVDPSHPDSRPHVLTPSRQEYRQQTAREWARRAVARGKRSRLRDEVDVLRAEVERLKAERGERE
jgi:hypothetical protein